MNVPVIASKIAGIPEVVIHGRTGYLISPGHVGQLVEAVIKLWSDQEACRTMGRQARQLIEDKMDKKKQFGVFRDYFYQIILSV